MQYFINTSIASTVTANLKLHLKLTNIPYDYTVYHFHASFRNKKGLNSRFCSLGLRFNARPYYKGHF